jgi:hypothetical protein
MSDEVSRTFCTFCLRDGGAQNEMVEDDRFRMWMNGTRGDGMACNELE